MQDTHEVVFDAVFIGDMGDDALMGDAHCLAFGQVVQEGAEAYNAA
jgi:hypothetical protein